MYRPIHIFDLQATSTSPAYGYVIEFAHAYYDRELAQWKKTVEFIKLPKDEELPRHIQKITGIKEEDLDCGWSQSKLKSYVKNLVESQPEALYVSHYAQFEKAFIRDLLSKKTFESMEWLCTHKLSKLIYPFLPSHSLRAAAGHAGFSLGALKRSHGQLDANIFLWQKLYREMKEQFALESYRELEAWIPKRKKDIKIIYQEKGPSKKYLKISDKERLSLPDAPGVYRFYSVDGRLLYIGKAKSLKTRVNSYFTGNPKRLGRKAELVIQIARIEFDVLNTPVESALYECLKIKAFDPPYNQALTPRKQKHLYAYDRDLNVRQVEGVEREGSSFWGEGVEHESSGARIEGVESGSSCARIEGGEHESSGARIEGGEHESSGARIEGRKLLLSLKASEFESLDFLLSYYQGAGLSEEILFGFAEESVIEEAIELFYEEYPQLKAARSKRDLLAWCYSVFLDSRSDFDENIEAIEDAGDEEELIEEIEETDFENPEDVKLSLYNVCAHIAKSHMKMKLMGKLLDSRIHLCDGNDRELSFELMDGRIKTDSKMALSPRSSEGSELFREIETESGSELGSELSQNSDPPREIDTRLGLESSRCAGANADLWDDFQKLSSADSFEWLRVFLTEIFRIHRSEAPDTWVKVEYLGANGQYRPLNLDFWSRYL